MSVRTVALALLLATSAAAAADPAAECSARKLAVAAAYTQCRLAVDVRAARSGRTPSYGACDLRFASKLARIEQRLGDACPTRGDAAAMRAAAARYTEGLGATARGELHCSEDPQRLAVGVAPTRPIPTGSQPAGANAIEVADGVYMAPGFGNTFLVTTSEGNVVIDTSFSLFAASHVAALKAIDDGPIRYVILTHGHQDHTGGVGMWRQPGTQVIAQAEQTELLHYQRRLQGVLAHRSAEQFSILLGLPRIPFAAPDAPVVNHGAPLFATTTFERFCEFRLGGLTFQLIHTPGETYDHLTVWIPEAGIAFPGDNIYGSFPNLYTLRGTKPRWALDYVASLDLVQSLQPAVLAGSHEDPIYGAQAVHDHIQQYRDALLYVHDATVRGMNAGADVFSLMKTVELPPELSVPEGYGAVAWTVRGIYEGYLGWFDENPATMYDVAPAETYRELVTLLGGTGAITARATALVAEGRHAEAIRLTDVVLAADAADTAALTTRLAAVEALLAASVNVNEQGWLNGARRDLRARLGL